MKIRLRKEELHFPAAEPSMVSPCEALKSITFSLILQVKGFQHGQALIIISGEHQQAGVAGWNMPTS